MTDQVTLVSTTSAVKTDSGWLPGIVDYKVSDRLRKRRYESYDRLAPPVFLRDRWWRIYKDFQMKCMKTSHFRYGRGQRVQALTAFDVLRRKLVIQRGLQILLWIIPTSIDNLLTQDWTRVWELYGASRKRWGDLIVMVRSSKPTSCATWNLLNGLLAL